MARWLAPVAGVVALLALGACSGQGGTHTASDTGPAQRPPASTSSPGASADTTSGHKIIRPADPLAPARMPAVLRPGQHPQQRLSSSPADLRAAVQYGDGVRLRVLSIQQGRVSGAGTGVIAGPTTSFSLLLSNDGTRPVDLSQVVVTAVYGVPGRVARPVYDSSAQDFAGIVRHGGQARARYAFAIPVNDLSHVSIHVDFDSRHAAATFRGNAG